MQERERAMWLKSLETKTTPPQETHMRERERARGQWELVVPINNLCPKHHHKQRHSIASSIGLKRHWNTTMREKEREQRAQFQSWRIDEHKWEYEREREPMNWVYDGRTHELSYHKKKKKAVLVLLLLLFVLEWRVACAVRTWTPSKVGLQPRRSMSMSHTHIVCLVGRVTIDWESWQYRNTRTYSVTTRMKDLVRDLRIHDVARKEVRWRKS